MDFLTVSQGVSTARCKVSWAWAVVNVSRGFTPLHLACQMGHWHLISCLARDPALPTRPQAMAIQCLCLPVCLRSRP